MSRVLRIELRRSNALPLLLSVLAVAVLGEVLLGYARFWDGSWMKFVTGQRGDLVLMVGLAVAAGAMQSGRDHRRGVLELFASAPLPRRRRIVPVTAALGLAAVVAYLVVFAAGALWLAPQATYADPAAIAGVVAVGVVALVAAAWLGLLAGHLVPSRLTAPIATVVALIVVVLLPEVLDLVNGPNGAALNLLTPGLTASTEGAASVPVRVSAVQGLWMLALAVSALGAFAATRRRFRLLAALPAVLGLALVVPRLPHGDSYLAAYVIDPAASAPVCATGLPRVCVTQVHANRLPQVTGPARTALAALARLPDPPTAVVEYPQIETRETMPPPSADTVWMNLEVSSNSGRDGLLPADDLAYLGPSLLANLGVTTSDCPVDGDRSSDRYAASDVGAAWLQGRPTPDQRLGEEHLKLVEAGWAALSRAPEAEQLRRVSAARQAYLTCDGDPYTLLTEGTPK